MCVSYIPPVVGTRERLTRGDGGDGVKLRRLVGVAVGGALQNVHQVGDEEVALERRHAFLRQDGRLATHGARQRQAVGRDVVLQTPGRGKEQATN